MKTTHTFFCDETGSTGAQLHSNEQPMFADGGWIVAHEDCSSAMRLIEQLEAQSGCQGTELKGSKLVRHPRGQALLRKASDEMGQFAVPSIYIVEKRFSLCGKLVDTFFDPAFNPATPWAERSDPELLQSQAQVFYETNSPLIEEFAEAFRVYDPERVRRNAEQWVDEFERADQKEFAEKIRSTLPTIERQIHLEGRASDDGSLPPGLDSLNLTIVHQVFQFVEQHCPFPCDVVHDQTASLEPIFRYFFELYGSGPRQRFVMKDGRATVTGYQNVGSLSFASSAKQPLIRAADFALAAVRCFVTLALTDKPIPADITLAALPHLGGIWCAVFSAMHPNELAPFPPLGGVLASAQWVTKVFLRFNNEVRQVMGTDGPSDKK